MALWFVSYAMSPITVTIYDVSIVIVYDVTLLLSMTYHFQSRLGKNDCTDIWVIKLKHQVSPSIGFRVPHCIPVTVMLLHNKNMQPIRTTHFGGRSHGRFRAWPWPCVHIGISSLNLGFNFE